jgi:CRISPR-associated protein (TIGR03984 family)
MSQELCQVISVDTIKENDDKTLINWLQIQAKQYQLKYLLAHGEDGVIWGHFNDNYQLLTADTIFDKDIFNIDLPKLRLLTLQQCRVFGDLGEVLLWKIDKNWQARIIQENSSIEHISEEQILWGTQKEKGKNGEDGEKDGFTLLSNGSQGLKHAVPLAGFSNYFNPNQKKLYRPVRMLVKHYIKYDDETGLARIFISRLVSLKPRKVIRL